MPPEPDASLPTGGALYIVGTPIGNLDDITVRAAKTLAAVDQIAAEDTRRAGILLQHLGISKPLTSYHAHNEHRKTADILDRIAAGAKVALLTDAGMPVVSDPGYLLVRDAVARGITPIVIPGVSAVTTAAAAAGLPMAEFLFAAYLPQKGQKRQTELRRLLAACSTVILFESPHRVDKLLADLAAVAPAADIALLRELTKLHEEQLRGTAPELIAATQGRTWKGEFTVVIHRGKTTPDLPDDADA